MSGFLMDESAVTDCGSPPCDSDRAGADAESTITDRSPLANKTRSMSDGGGTPSKLSPSPHIIEASRRTSKDDINIKDAQPPTTPRRSELKGLSLQMPPRQFTPPPAASNPYVKPPPLSPKLDHSQIYASPTNILPRRSRGLDFSRAATSLHHSTLAERASPDSSPTTGERAMAIPGRRSDYGGPEQTSTSLWSIMGNHEKMNISSSLGSTQAVGSDSSSSSDDEDLMDEDMDEPYVTTPQVSKSTMSMGPSGPFWITCHEQSYELPTAATASQAPQKKTRGPLGLGFNLAAASLSKSPPSNSVAKSRRESISWQANQLHISAVDGEESGKSQSDADGGSGDGQPKGVVKRTVTRRGNLLPKTKTFARIRAALLEEGAPAEAETRREAEVVKQVRESDVDLEAPRIPPGPLESVTAISALSSPNLENLDDIAEDDMMGDLSSGFAGSFKQHAIKNSKGKTFWDTFSESSSMGGTRTTPPPPPFFPRGSSSGISEDAGMDSPLLAGPSGNSSSSAQGPSAAEITRRINNKRRRDDDFDPVSFKRRAVSPGMSAHNSPVLQSPMQRDSATWGSRPGSTGGEKAGSSAQSDTGSTNGTPSMPPSGTAGRLKSQGRIGFQGMVDTNDGIMRMSIE